MPYRLAAAGDYQHPVLQNLIHALKFSGIRAAALPLGRLVIRHLERVSLDLQNPLFLPVPLHPRRERMRGFNQSEIIARIAADYFGFEYLPGILVRTRETNTQSGLPHEKRSSNVAGCFAITNAAPIMDRVVVVVDDVTTSGATFRETAAILCAHGARSIICIAAAKA